MTSLCRAGQFGQARAGKGPPASGERKADQTPSIPDPLTLNLQSPGQPVCKGKPGFCRALGLQPRAQTCIPLQAPIFTVRQNQ